MGDPTVRVFIENGLIQYATTNLRREIQLEVYDLDAGDEESDSTGFEEIEII